MDTDRLIKWATGITVSIVTSIAAYVSYTHISAVSHNPVLAFSIDGMIVTSTLVIMAANRAKLERVWLAYVGLWLGILATLAANVAYGLPNGVVASIGSTWPAVCFVVSVETIAQLSRRKRRVRSRAVKPVIAPVAATKEPEPVDTKEPEPIEDVLTVGPIKVPGIQAIRKTLKCGQPVAYEVQAVMVRDRITDIHKAKKIRDKEKADGNSGTIV